jgi:hypothetical protein
MFDWGFTWLIKKRKPKYSFPSLARSELSGSELTQREDSGGLVVWQEGREAEERFMSATVKQRKTGVGECYPETRGGHLASEVKTANEIICHYVWEKLYPTPFL